MADKTADTAPTKKPWILTAIGAIGIVLLLLLPVIPLYKDASTMPDMARWIGQFHPVLLHLPIGIFILILLQEIFGFMRNEKEKGVGFPLMLGILSSVGAVITGYMLWRNGDGAYGELGESHLWGGVIFTSAVIATAVIKKWALLNGWVVISYKLPLVASVAIMSFASHDGGTMTHGAGFLTRYSPFEEKDDSDDDDSDAPVAAEPEVYANVIAPIFEQKCVQCHKEGKSKGRFRMDTYELLVKGGKEGAGLVAGDVEGSNIVVRMDLPMDDEEHMPPRRQN